MTDEQSRDQSEHDRLQRDGQSISVTIDDLTAKMSNFLFWRFQYCKRFALLNGETDWRSVAAHASSLHDEKVGHINTLRYICNAISSVKNLGSCAYDIDWIPMSSMPYCMRAYEISLEHEYLLPDLVEPPRSKFLLKDILAGKIPLPPRHFLIRNEPEAAFASDLVNHLYNVEYFPVGTEGINKNIDAIYKRTTAGMLREELSGIDDIDDPRRREKLFKIYNLTKNRRLNLNHANLGNKITRQEIIEIVEAHNSAHHTTFKDTAKSRMHRAIGLFLWDQKTLYGRKGGKVHKKLDDILDKAGIPAPDQPDQHKRNKILNHTSKCIRERSVLAFQRN